jgi:glucokinase-like ROK family protein
MRDAAVGRIFKIIRDRGPLSSSDIVKWSGLAKSTVSVNVDRLIATGLVRQEARPDTKRTHLKVAENAGYVIGVDIGQTHLAVGLCDLEGRVRDSERLKIDLSQEGPESVLAKVAQLIRVLSAPGADPLHLLGIGVGVPGPVDFVHGMPVNPPVMPGWDHFPVAAALKEKFACPVFLDNDVNVMALGERDRGVAQNADSFVFVKVGHGIGAGLVVEGELYRGAKGAAGDIGHIGLDGDTTPCRCGNQGCLEVVAGGSALEARAAEAAASGLSPFLAARRAEGAELSAQTLALAASSGDATALQLVMDSGMAVGTVLAKLVNFFNPSVIVIGGRFAHLGERYLASIREAVYRRSTPLATSDLVIKRSLLGDDCGMVGAAVLVLDEILSHRSVSKLVEGSNDGESA